MMSSRLKLLHPFQAFSTQSPSSTLSYTKMKTLIHTLIFSHVCRVVRSLSKVKSIVVQTLKENQSMVHIFYPRRKYNLKQKKIFLGSFRLHYNWCSTRSHVMPVPAPVYDEISAEHLYSDMTWNGTTTLPPPDGTGSLSSTTETRGVVVLSQRSLSGYLQWLEEKSEVGDSDVNEIDKLADLFIANCHEKFVLEKQESDRNFQEMLARSL